MVYDKHGIALIYYDKWSVGGWTLVAAAIASASGGLSTVVMPIVSRPSPTFAY